MQSTETQDLSTLYEADETAWLEIMSELIARNRYAELDYVHLSEYLSDMAKRDRREVVSRLVILLAHLLKWEYQESQRSKSWKRGILVQQRELNAAMQRGILWNHATESLGEAYEQAVLQAAIEADMEEKEFPKTCPWTLDEILEKKLET